MCEETATERTMRLIHDEWRAEVFAEIRQHIEHRLAVVAPSATSAWASTLGRKWELESLLAWIDERNSE